MASSPPPSFYNLFDPAKKYKRLLFRPGQGLQSRELNEMHSTIMNEVVRLANVLHTEGSILSGGETKLEDTGTLTIKDATLFALGYTHEVPGVTMAIASNEDVTIGVLIDVTTVTDLEDVTLRDPAVNTRNYNQPGAYREKMVAHWIKSSAVQQADVSRFFPIHVIADGQIVSQVVEAPEFSGLDQRLAKYDVSANGSFVVDGFIASYIEDDNAAHQHVFSVSEGSAHVEGYIVDYESARRAFVDWATDTRPVNNEPLVYTAPGWYATRWQPIAGVTEISAQKVATRTITHGSFTGVRDLLPDTPVVSITSVTQGGTTYQAGTSYYLDGDYINWSPGGTEPAANSSYNITYVYQSTVAPIVSDDRTKIYLDAVNVNSTVTIDYTHYIPRIDRLVLGRDGTISVLKGIADYINPSPPNASSGLSLAIIRVAYGSKPIINADFYRAFKNSDIQRMAERQDRVDYNLSQLMLRDQARGADPTAIKKNIFTDPFTSNNERDLGVTQNAMTSYGILEPQVVSQDLLFRTGLPLTLAFTERRIIDQNAYTRTRYVNEFEAVLAPPAVVTVTPSNYTWTSQRTQTIVIDEDVANGAASVEWARHQLDDGSGSTDRHIQGGDWSLFQKLTGQAVTGTTWPTEIFGFMTSLVGPGTVLGTQTNTSQTLISGIQGETYYIPQIPIRVQAGKFNVGETVRITFDSIFVGNATANSVGQVDFTFTAPPNIVSGSKLISAVGQASGVTGLATFVGTPQILLTVNSTRRFVVSNPLVVYWYDPVAQTFTPEEDISLSSVELQFANTTAAWVDVLICETDNGYPNTDKVVAHTRLNNTAVLGAGWTKATFANTPRLAKGEEYALVVMTPDNALQIRTAELGKWDMANQRWLTRQGYLAGVFFNSSNARAWTAIQTEDLMFRVNAATFTSDSGWVDVDDVMVVGVTDLMVLADVENQPGASVEFRARLVNRDNTEIVMSPGVSTSFEDYTGQIVLRYRLRTTIANNSPKIGGNITLSLGYVQFPAVYVTKRFTINGTQIKAIMNAYEPSGTAVNLYYEDIVESLVAAASNLWTAVPRALSSDIGTYRYTGTALTGARPALVTIGGTLGVERIAPSAKKLTPNDFFFGDVETIGSNKLYVQMPILNLSDPSGNWLQSRIATEWYYSLPVPNTVPSRMAIGNTELTLGTLGALNPGQFAFGNNDTLASNRIYIRMPTAEIVGGVNYPRDPSYGANFVRASYNPNTQPVGHITASEWIGIPRTGTVSYGDDKLEVAFATPSNLAIPNTRLRVELTTTARVRRPYAIGLRSYIV